MTGQLTPPRHDSGSSTIRSIWSSKVPREKPSVRTFLPRKRYTPIMSELPVPQPPQYTPPPPPVTRPQYDFIKPLAFVFEDPNWIQKMLMGALFSLAVIPTPSATPTIDAAIAIIGNPLVICLLIRSEHRASDIFLPLGAISYPLYVIHSPIIILGSLLPVIGMQQGP